MRRRGWTMQAIGDRFGLSGCRVWQLMKAHQKSLPKETEMLAPVADWLLFLAPSDARQNAQFPPANTIRVSRAHHYEECMQRILTTLIREVGLATTISLVRGWGGRTIRVPTKVVESDPLALALGLGPAQKLVARFADEKLQLPDERHALLDLRNERIAALAADGRSQESIGVEYGLTRQGVAAVLRKVADAQERAQRFAGSTARQPVAESAP